MADEPQDETLGATDDQAAERGTTIHAWTFPSHVRPDRTPGWYLLAGLIVLGLIIYAVLTRNFLFAVIILVTSVIVVFNAYDVPRTVNFAIMSRGVKIDNLFYEWSLFSDFWIVYKPPRVKTLYFRFKSNIRPDIPVPLADENPLPIRQTLTGYLREDTTREDENIAEAVNRAFKL